MGGDGTWTKLILPPLVWIAGCNKAHDKGKIKARWAMSALAIWGEPDLLSVLKMGSAEGFVVENWALFDQLAAKGHILKQQRRQSAEIIEGARERHVGVPMTGAVYEHSTLLDEDRYRQLTGREPDFDYFGSTAPRPAST